MTTPSEQGLDDEEARVRTTRQSDVTDLLADRPPRCVTAGDWEPLLDGEHGT